MPKFSPDPQRLCDAIERARLAMRGARVLRFNLVKTFAGTRYSEEGSDKVQPLNMLSLYVGVVLRQIAPQSPRVMLSTFLSESRHTAETEQTWINQEIARTDMAGTFRRAVLDGLFGMGIVKVGIASPAEAAQMGWEQVAGRPYARLIDFDDYVVDLHARLRSEVNFEGHRFRVPLEVVQEDKNYRKQRKDLTATIDSIYNQQGDTRVSMIGRTIYQSQEQEFEDHVDLWEIYLPRHNEVWTLISDDNGRPRVCDDGEPLRIQKWIGPQRGPYHVLSYGDVPGNLLPKAPLQDLADEHEFINHLYRKLIRQSDRQKTMLFVAGAADADGNRVQQGDDGDIIRVDNPERIKEVGFGGPNQQLFAMFVDSIQRFNLIAGNIESSGGLSVQAKTARQDSMLRESASGMILDKQETTAAFIDEVLTDLCWFHHHHPTRPMETEYKIDGLPQIPGVPISASPEDRARVPWEQLDIKLDVYSVRRSTPESRAKDLLELVMQVITPMMPALQAAGVQFDVQAFLKKIGQYKDMPDLSELLTLREPPQDPSGGSDPLAQASPQETEHVRTSLPGRTQQGSDLNLASQLMSGNSQGGESEPALNGTGG